MEGKRGFEIVSTWKNAGISLPRRKTAMSAGYDIESAGNRGAAGRNKGDSDRTQSIHGI